MKILVRIIYIYLFIDFIFSQDISSVKKLEKNSKVTVSSDDNMIVFNSEDFDEGKEMYFKIKAEKDAFFDNATIYGTNVVKGINYQFIGGDVGYDGNKLEDADYQISTDYENSGSKNYKIKYFTIKKDINKFRNTKGNLLLICFTIEYGDVEITNTEEDEGKIIIWIGL